MSYITPSDYDLWPRLMNKTCAEYILIHSIHFLFCFVCLLRRYSIKAKWSVVINVQLTFFNINEYEKKPFRYIYLKKIFDISLFFQSAKIFVNLFQIFFLPFLLFYTLHTYTWNICIFNARLHCSIN